MNRKTLLVPFTLFILISLLALPGCTKFEEGPDFSLRTKKGRVANDWKVDKGFVNGIEVVEPATSFHVSFERREGVKFTYFYSTPAGDTTNTIKGVWEFINDEDIAMALVDDGMPLSKVWHITRLTSDELWATEVINNDVYKYQLIPR